MNDLRLLGLSFFVYHLVRTRPFCVFVSKVIFTTHISSFVLNDKTFFKRPQGKNTRSTLKCTLNAPLEHQFLLFGREPALFSSVSLCSKRAATRETLFVHFVAPNTSASLQPPTLVERRDCAKSIPNLPPILVYSRQYSTQISFTPSASTMRGEKRKLTFLTHPPAGSQQNSRILVPKPRWPTPRTEQKAVATQPSRKTTLI